MQDPKYNHEYLVKMSNGDDPDDESDKHLLAQDLP